MRQRKSGGLSWLVTVSRPDNCARLAQPASKVNSRQGCGVYRINQLLETGKGSPTATVLKYRPGLHLETPVLAGRPDSAYEDRTGQGRCPMGDLFGLPPILAPRTLSRFAAVVEVYARKSEEQRGGRGVRL